MKRMIWKEKYIFLRFRTFCIFVSFTKKTYWVFFTTFFGPLNDPLNYKVLYKMEKKMGKGGIKREIEGQNNILR